MKYNKLVRDKIPEIIADSGLKATFRVLDETEMMSFLEKKLDEEVAEFRESKSIEELADICEVVFALADAIGQSAFELGIKWCEKNLERGGFSKRICLIEVEE